MKKSKARLREKIKNKPKGRNASRRRKKTAGGQMPAEDFNPPPVQTVDQGMEVMSHVILDFARPLLETCDGPAAEKKAISLSIFVWNATLLDEAQRTATLGNYLSECRSVMPPEQWNTLAALVEQLVQDKLARFADNRKKITNCTFGDYNDSRHIEVGYTMA
jgi:hypothetical protein